MAVWTTSFDNELLLFLINDGFDLVRDLKYIVLIMKLRFDQMDPIMFKCVEGCPT